MEFPNGPEQICPLCGNGDDNDNDSDEDLGPTFVCQICRTRCTLSDEHFLKYWTKFENPKWSTSNYPSCSNCFRSSFGKSNPDFEASGLAPDTYVVWKDALHFGVDLGPRLSDIEMSNGIRRLNSCSLSRGEMIRWLNSDCHIDEAEQWSSFFSNFDLAMAWRNAGFSPSEARWWSSFFGDFDLAMAWHDAGFGPDEETTRQWIKWGCTPKKAAKFVQQGIDYAPSIVFKELGVNLIDAVFYEAHEMSADQFDELFIGPWLSSGLSAAEIVSLRDQLVAQEEVFMELNDTNLARFDSADQEYFHWDALPNNFKNLKEIGLPISAANLEKYWGLSSNEILEVIDAGGRPGVAAELIRHGISVSKLGIVERLLDADMDASSAILLSQRGFLMKHFKDIEKKGDVFTTLSGLANLLANDSEMKIDEALSWREIGASLSQVKLWKLHGFTPHEAVKWSNEGFQPKTASGWRDAGVDSPVTARRRHDAGLQP
jgi:hypothetical protein